MGRMGRSERVGWGCWRRGVEKGVDGGPGLK